jgi:Ca2+-binding RTX toxin-like protein
MGIWLPGPGPTSGDDTYQGDATAEIVDGGAGNDTLSGGDGDDTITPGGGADEVDAGAGNDTVNITAPGGGVSTLEGGAGVDTLDASTYDSSLTYTSISGQPGVLLVADYTATGFEVIRAGNAPDFFGMGSYGGPLEIWAGGGIDVFVSTEGKLHGGEGNDSFIDSLPGSEMYGENGDDWFWISGYFDGPVASRLIDGGAGRDVLQANISALIDLQDGVASSGHATFQVSGIEEVQVSARWGFWSGVGGSDADETFSVMASMDDGSAGVDLLGRGGNDTLSGSLGNDLLDGGTGVDTVSYANAVSGVSVNLAILVGQETSGAGRDILKDVENLIGSGFGDTLLGDGLGNTLDGAAGDDALNGGAGADWLIGGAGDDALLGGSGNDTILDENGTSGAASIHAGAGDDVIALSGTFATGSVNGGGGIDQITFGGLGDAVGFIGVEILNTTGGVTTASAAQFRSFSTIRRSESDLAGSVTLVFTTGGVLNLANKTPGRDANVTGSAIIDVITGSTGNDVIDGLAGGDTIYGVDGNDTLIGGEGADKLDGGEGDDIIDGGVGNDTITGGAGNDTIADTGGVIVAINSGIGDDLITLGTTFQFGTVNGGVGADQVNASGFLRNVAFIGVETLNTDGGLVTASAAQMEAFETIRVSSANAAGAVSLRLSEAGAIDLAGELGTRGVTFTGSVGDDDIRTGDGSDTITAGTGNDVIRGRAGNDLILQGSGDGRDLVDGGAGADTYRLTGTAAAETFRIYTRAEALAAGMTGLAAGTEIVVTRDGTDNASIIAELDNIEEIEINALVATANNGNGTVDGGSAGGDTIMVIGDFTSSSLDYSTIRIAGSEGSDTIDISGLTSAHRVVFTSNGGEDSVIGQPRPQDVFEGVSGASELDLLLAAQPASHEVQRTMLDGPEGFMPLDTGVFAPPELMADLSFQADPLGLQDRWFVLSDVASITG